MQGYVFIATSLDGFIAREDGSLDWLPGADGTTIDEDHGYNAFMNRVDALVMGSRTYEKVLDLGFWSYGDKPVMVLTTRLGEMPPPPSAMVEFLSGEPSELAAQLDERGLHHVYLDGGQTIRRFLAAGLVHRVIVTRVPVLLGQGIPLFGPMGRDVLLRHVATRAFPSGLVQSEYEVQSGSPPALI